MWLTVLGIVLFAYGLVCVGVGAVKRPAALWNRGILGGFRKVLGDFGTQVFALMCGVIAVSFGVWLAFLL